MKSGKTWLIFELNNGTHWKMIRSKGVDAVKYSGVKPMFRLNYLCVRKKRLTLKMY